VVIVGAGQLDVTAVGAWAAESLASPEGALLPLGHPGLEEAAAASPTSLAAVPQDHLEPVLLGHLRGFPGAEVRLGPSWPASTRTPTGSRSRSGNAPAAPTGSSGPPG
jgi:hypothetical protein